MRFRKKNTAKFPYIRFPMGPGEMLSECFTCHKSGDWSVDSQNPRKSWVAVAACLYAQPIGCRDQKSSKWRELASEISRNREPQAPASIYKVKDDGGCGSSLLSTMANKGIHTHIHMHVCHPQSSHINVHSDTYEHTGIYMHTIQTHKMFSTIYMFNSETVSLLV